jgi:N utilization substance protein A
MISSGLSFGGQELLLIADAVSREKAIHRDVVLEAMETAISSAAKRKYGAEHDIKCTIDRKSGEARLFRVITVVEAVEEPAREITLDAARHRNPEAQLADQFFDPLPPIDFGRIAAQAAKQVMTQKMRDAERDKQFEEYQDRTGEIISGTVKRAEFGTVVVDLGKTEAVMRRDQSIPRENFRPGDRIRALVQDVRRERTGPQIFLSRAHPDFLAKLFAQEVPEIYDGVITIKSVARDPGSRAKIAVSSRDSGIDPVGSCVGVRGARVQAVTNELQGEKIDIIQWTSDPAALVVSALSPADVSKVVIDEIRNRLEVVVPEEQLSLAIGRRGQNVKLASELVGLEIDVMTEDEESRRRSEEFNRLSALFIEALNVEDVIAQLLVSDGFKSVEEIVESPIEEITAIEGFDEDVANELKTRAQNYLDEAEKNLQKKFKDLKIKKDLLSFEGLSHSIILRLAEGGVKSLDDFADLARDDFYDLVPNSGLKPDAVDALIMKAREHWFADEKTEASSNEAAA